MIRWGMVGCGNVTLHKSAPAFNKVKDSQLFAIFSRNTEKAEHCAERFGIPHVFNTFEELIANEHISAVYIATPPDSHAFYSIKALESGKAVYVEKPMALHYRDALRMSSVAKQSGSQLFVAYYRRELPYFLYIKKIIESGELGNLKSFSIQLVQPPRKEDFNTENLPWRLIPEIGGMGYFYDLAPHQIDLILFLFGKITDAGGITENRNRLYDVPDYVEAEFLLEGNVKGNGIWYFTSLEAEKTDQFSAEFEKGVIEFSTFSKSVIKITMNGKELTHTEDFPKNIQHPFIQSVVNEMTGKGKSNADLDAAVSVNYWMEKICGLSDV